MRHRPDDAELQGDAGPLFARARRTDPETSHAAAASLTPKRLGEVDRSILEALRASKDGLTTLEMVDVLKIERVSVSPRMAVLARQRMVRDSGRRRAGATGRAGIVWEAIP